LGKYKYLVLIYNNYNIQNNPFQSFVIWRQFMLSYRDLTAGFKKLNIDSNASVLAHASLSKFGEVRGGAETLLGAFLSSFHTVIMPAFTYKTILIPEEGPENNGIVYGSGHDLNRMTEFFSRNLEVDPTIGKLAENLRKHSNAYRSTHPILSFTGINAEDFLKTQTIENPFAPISALYNKEGFVLLSGVDQTVNTAIHFAEQIAGRKTFIRWALTPRGVVECRDFPGCSDGFNQVNPHIEHIKNQIQIGDAQVIAIPIKPMIEIVVDLIKKDGESLLCDRDFCPRCDAVRYTLKINNN
jgi:aminoglycoside 3-N-acetyltransferase